MNDLELVESLVRIPSPTGSEAEAVRFLQERARRDGLHVIEDAPGNFVAEAGTGPRRILFVGHVDTVPGHIPVRVEGGELWGRGAVDAKGPLAAAYCAARLHRSSKAVTFRVVGAVDEEGDSRGAKGLTIPWTPDVILIGEPSGVHGITIGYKGILRGRFRIERERSHGAHPGSTAVEAAAAFWTDLSRHLELEDRFDALQGHLLALDTETNGLVDRVAGKFHLRIPPGTAPDQLARRVEAFAPDGVVLEWGERQAPAVASHRTTLVAALLEAIRSDGGTPRLLRKTGTADFNHLAERFPGVPIAAYGPGDSSLDHTPRERLKIEEFQAAIRILSRVVHRLALAPEAVAA